MNWIALHIAALRDALRRMTLSPLSTLFTALTVGVAITLPVGLYLTLKNLNHLSGDLPTQPEVSVFISGKSSQPQREAIKRVLEQRTDLAKLRFVDSEEALAHLNRQGLADLTAGLNRNPLPDAWIITPRQATPAQMETLRQDLATLPGVESVLADSTWAARMQAILRIGQYLVLLLSALFGLALTAIASNAIRAQILARRDEIEVSRLIGATDRFIRRPFLYYGALQGMAGALAALGILLLLGWMLADPVGRLASLYGSPYMLTPLSTVEGSLILCCAVLFSWFGAWIAVSRTLRQID
jgi:cell division transport system permease protein